MTTTLSSPDTRLLPCPFCGGTATMEQTESNRWSVGCDSADEVACMGYQNFTTFARRSDATKAWNTRPCAAQSPGLRLEIIYGLLWLVEVDKSTVSGMATSIARKTALEMIDKDGQARGIGIAKRAVRAKMLQAISSQPTINPRAG